MCTNLAWTVAVNIATWIIRNAADFAADVGDTRRAAVEAVAFGSFAQQRQKCLKINKNQKQFKF